jgi:hypothetical protein
MNDGRSLSPPGLAVSAMLVLIASLVSAADTPLPDQPGSLARIIAITGHVTLGMPGDSNRHAQRGEDLLSAQVLRTHNASSVQIRLDDDSLLLLEENTSVVALSIPLTGSNPDATLHLFLERGAVRAIGDQRGFIIDTALAKVHGRTSSSGSTYDCALGAELDCGVYDGAITVENARGMVWLGGESDFNFAHVADAETPPDALLDKPEALKNPNAPPARPRLTPAPVLHPADSRAVLPEPSIIRIIPSRQ